MSLGEKLRYLRKQKNKTLNDVAEEIDLSIGFLSEVERGEKTPSVRKLEKLADYFDVSTDYLLDRNQKEIENPDIRAIARAGNKLSSDEAAELRNLAKRLFPNAFENDKEES